MKRFMQAVSVVAALIVASACGGGGGDGGITGPNTCQDSKALNYLGPLPCTYPAPTKTLLLRVVPDDSLDVSSPTFTAHLAYATGSKDAVINSWGTFFPIQVPAGLDVDVTISGGTGYEKSHHAFTSADLADSSITAVIVANCWTIRRGFYKGSSPVCHSSTELKTAAGANQFSFYPQLKPDRRISPFAWRSLPVKVFLNDALTASATLVTSPANSPVSKSDSTKVFAYIDSTNTFWGENVAVLAGRTTSASAPAILTADVVIGNNTSGSGAGSPFSFSGTEITSGRMVFANSSTLVQFFQAINMVLGIGNTCSWVTSMYTPDPLCASKKVHLPTLDDVGMGQKLYGLAAQAWKYGARMGLDDSSPSP